VAYENNNSLTRCIYSFFYLPGQRTGHDFIHREYRLWLARNFTPVVLAGQGTKTLSLDLTGAPYVIELTWSGSTDPDSTDNETVAN